MPAVRYHVREHLHGGVLCKGPDTLHRAQRGGDC